MPIRYATAYVCDRCGHQTGNSLNDDDTVDLTGWGQVVITNQTNGYVDNSVRPVDIYCPTCIAAVRDFLHGVPHDR